MKAMGATAAVTRDSTFAPVAAIAFIATLVALPAAPAARAETRSNAGFRSGLPHLLFLLLLALIVYQPWIDLPFPIVDYPEFIPSFQNSSSTAAGLHEVTAYYRTHGRSSYLAYGQLALNWALFGERPVGWNFAVFAYMAAAMTSVWLLLLRLRSTRMAATLATAVLVVSTAAAQAWLRPTGEPLALLFMAAAFMIARTYQRAQNWSRQLIALTLLFLGIGLAKDLLAPLMLFPLMVALTWRGGFSIPKWTRRNLWLCAASLAVLALFAVMIGSALAQRAADAYTRAYGSSHVSPLEFVGIFWSILLPLTTGSSRLGFRAIELIADVGFVVVLVAGWTKLLRGSHQRSRVIGELNGWLALLFFGTLLYLPLGWFSPFYALPFALGTTALFARALSTLEKPRPVWRHLSRAAAVLVLIVGAGTAFNAARQEAANRRLHRQLSRTIGALKPDSLIVKWPEVNQWQWTQQAVVIQRYASMQHDLSPAGSGARDVACGSTYGRTNTGGRVLLINYPEACGEFDFASGEIVQQYIALRPLPGRRSMRLQLVVLGDSSALRQ